MTFGYDDDGDPYRPTDTTTPYLAPIAYPGADYRPPTNPQAVTALVTGLLGLGVIPLVFGIIGLQKSKRIFGVGKGMSIAGIALGGFGIFSGIVAVIGLIIALNSIPTGVSLIDRDFIVAVEQIIDQPRLGECSVYSERFEGFLPAPCDGQHDAEVVGYRAITGAYPGIEYLIETGTEFCQSAFASYVGVAPDSSEFYYHALLPTQIEFGLGFRRIVCIAASDGQFQMPAGSVRGLAR